MLVFSILLTLSLNLHTIDGKDPGAPSEENDMEMEGLARGLEALAVFLFLAAIVVAGSWYRIRKLEAQHETLRRMIEKGQPIDQTLLDKLLGGSKRQDRDQEK